MKKSFLLKSAAVVLCMAMAAACCSCTPNDGDMEPDDDKIEDEDDDEDEEESEEEPSAESVVSEHVFEDRVCTDCGKTWNECFYEAMAGSAPNGHYYDTTINIGNELDANGTMEIATNGEGFFFDYETSINDDVKLSYSLRQYNDSFNNDAEVYAVDFSIETHFGVFSEYPEMGQIVLLTTYEGDPEDLIEAYKTGDIFNVDEPLRGYYYNAWDDRLYYSCEEAASDITLEEMFDGSEMITQEQFNEIYMENYAIFLSTIEGFLNSKGMSLHDLGIADWK